MPRSLPVLVECVPYRARLSVEACVARRKARRRTSQRYGTQAQAYELCGSCAVGAERERAQRGAR